MNLFDLVPAKNTKLAKSLDKPSVVSILNPFTDEPIKTADGADLTISIHYAFSTAGKNAVLAVKRESDKTVEPVRIVANLITDISGTVEFGNKSVGKADVDDKKLLEELLTEVGFVLDQLSTVATVASNFLPDEMRA